MSITPQVCFIIPVKTEKKNFVKHSNEKVGQTANIIIVEKQVENVRL